MYNFDGDLLFSCSDDSTVCMYRTDTLERLGLFQIGDSCKSIDVTKDSKLLFATSVTRGVKVFDCKNGDKVAEITVPGVYTKWVELSYSDKYFLVIYEDRAKDSWMRIYKVEDVLKWGKSEGSPDCYKEIKAPRDHNLNCGKFGPLDQTVYYCTDHGRLLRYDIEESSVIKAESIHRKEIFTINFSPDFTMLFTCSRDGICKLINPETFDVIQEFNFTFPCRNAAISPLYLADAHQKFHVLLCGGQDAKDVTTTGQQKGGFEMKLFNIIYNDELARIAGHFGTVHSIAFHPDGQSFASGAEDGYVHYHRMLPEYFTKRFE